MATENSTETSDPVTARRRDLVRKQFPDMSDADIGRLIAQATLKGSNVDSDLRDKITQVGDDYFREEKAKAKAEQEKTNFERLTPLDSEWCETDFPTMALPPRIRDYVLAAATSAQVPVDMAAATALGALATATRGNIRVRITDDYVEPCVLWWLLVASSGDRKSQNQRLLMKPIYDAERAINEDLRPIIQRDAVNLEALEADVVRAKRMLEKANEADRHEAQANLETARDRLNSFRPTKPVQLIADDATPEAVVRLLADNDETIALASTEGNIFGIVQGRYGDKPLVEVLLKAHAGDPHRDNRAGREPIILNEPRLSMVVATQPSVLQEVGSNPNLRGNGFVARLLPVYPKPLVGHRVFRPPTIPSAIRDDYFRLIEGLVRDFVGMGNERHELVLSDEAVAVQEVFNGLIEPRLDEMGDLAHMADWAGKLEGAVARIAGLLHVAEFGVRGSRRISGETYEAAMQIGCYLLDHAQMAFRVMTGQINAKDARAILAWATRHGLEQFSSSEILNSMKWPKERMTAGLETLRLHGYLRAMDASEYHKGAGRPSSQMYELNPDRPKAE